MFRTFQLNLIIYSITLFLIELYNVTHSPVAKCDTQPTPRHPPSCTFTQFTWCWPCRFPHHCPHIHDPLRATVTPILWILFRLRILSLTLRLRLGQCPVRDGWVHWISKNMSFKVIMTYKCILIWHIHTSIISWWWPLYATHDGVWNGPLSSGPEQFLGS